MGFHSGKLDGGGGALFRAPQGKVGVGSGDVLGENSWFPGSWYPPGGLAGPGLSDHSARAAVAWKSNPGLVSGVCSNSGTMNPLVKQLKVVSLGWGCPTCFAFLQRALCFG